MHVRPGFVKPDIHEPRQRVKPGPVRVVRVFVEELAHDRSGFVEPLFFHQQLGSRDRQDRGRRIFRGELIQSLQSFLGLPPFMKTGNPVHLLKSVLAAELDFLAAAAGAKRVDIHLRGHRKFLRSAS